MNKKQKKIVYLVIGIIILFAINQVSALTLEELLNSYSFDYAGETIGVMNITDFMQDTNSNSINDTLFFNISIYNATSGNYAFYMDIEDNETILTQSSSININSVPTAVFINASTILLSGKNTFNYTLRVYDSSDNLVYRRGNIATKTYNSYEKGYNVINIKDENVGNNYIRFNVTINSTKSSTENISIHLSYNESSISLTNQTQLSIGINNIFVIFDNESIKSTHFNGNYSITEVSIGSKIIPQNRSTNSYNYEDFAKTSYIKSYADAVIDKNENNLTDYLEINFTLNIKIAGDYSIKADLYDLDEQYLTTILKNVTLSTGVQVVSTNVSGPEIYASKLNGPFEITSSRLILNNNITDLRLEAYTTNVSAYFNFERPLLPDLNVSVNTYYNGSGNNVNVTIGNMGNATAFNIIVDIFNNETYENQTSLSVLNDSMKQLFTFAASGTSQGSLFTVIVDIDNLIDELNESNNVADNTLVKVDEIPKVILQTPLNSSTNDIGNVTLGCYLTDDISLKNVTLYGNWSGGWHANETKTITGISNSTTFNKTLPNGIYRWNCLANDNSSQKGWGDSNFTFEVSVMPPRLKVDFVYPTTNINVTQNQFFNVTLNVTCTQGYCSGINVSLDPIGFGNSESSVVASPPFLNVSLTENGLIINGIEAEYVLDYNNQTYEFKDLPSEIKDDLSMSTNIGQIEENAKVIYNHRFNENVRDNLTKVGYIFPEYACSFDEVSNILDCITFTINFTEAKEEQGINVNFSSNEFNFKGNNLTFIDPIIQATGAPDLSSYSGSSAIVKGLSDNGLAVLYSKDAAGLFLAVSPDNGKTWRDAGNTNLNCDLDQSGNSAVLLINSSGTLHAFCSKVASTSTIKTSYSTNGGANWSNPVTVLSTGVTVFIRIDGIVDVNNNLVLCAAIDGNSPTPDSVDIFNSSSGGLTWTRTQDVFSADNIDDGCAIEVDSKNMYNLVGVDMVADKIEYTNATQPTLWNAPVLVDSGEQLNLGHVDLETGPNDEIYILTQQLGASDNLSIFNSSNGGISWTKNTIDMGTTPISMFDMAVDKTGTIHTITEESSSDSKLQYSNSTNGGKTWSIVYDLKVPRNYNFKTPHLRGSRYPKFNNVDGKLDYVYFNGSQSDIYYDSLSIPFAPKGIISTTAGDKPFYTIDNNPFALSLNPSQSQLVTFRVNATGQKNTKWEFFAFVNLTSNMSINNITSKLNITIVVNDTTSPIVDIKFPQNITYSTSDVPLNFQVKLNEEGDKAFYTLNEGVTNFSMSSNDGFTYTASNSSIGDGIYIFQVYVNDTSGNRNDTTKVTFSLNRSNIVTYCRKLDAVNTIYQLKNNIVVSGNCFIINATNVSLEGNGHTINYGISSDGNAIFSQGFSDLTIRNLTLIINNTNRKNSRGIRAENGARINILNINIVSNCSSSSTGRCDGIMLVNTNNVSIYKANINTASSLDSNAILITSAGVGSERKGHKIYNSELKSYGSQSSGIEITGFNAGIGDTLVEDTYGYSDQYYGIIVNGGNFGNGNINISRSTITTRLSFRYALFLQDSEKSFIRDSSLSNVNDYDIKVLGGTHEFINSSYIDESVSNGKIIRKWYYRAYANDTTGVNVFNANITAYNVSNNYQSNLTTDSTGYTQMTEIIYYINNGGNKSYYSPFTIYATNSTYGTINHQINVTNLTNIYKDVFTFGTTGGLITCSDLDQVNTIYTLQNNISTTGTCFNITADNITLDGNGYSITGDGNSGDWGVYSESRSNITVKNIIVTNFSRGIYLIYSNNSLIENSTSIENSQYGIFLASSFNNIVKDSTANSNLFYGIVAANSNNNKIINNIVDSNTYYGIYLDTSSDNLVSGGNINASGQYAIRLQGGSLNNNLTNITITNSVQNDIFFASAGINGTYIIDMPHIGNYLFAEPGSSIYFKDSRYGEIRFLQAINGSGTNLTRDVMILNNSVSVRSDLNPGLNKSANVTLYEIGNRGFVNPMILRNGVKCSKFCYNFTALNATNVIFNVSSWTNYSIGNFVNDTQKFVIQNSSGTRVAWFGSEGNIVLKGSCTNQSLCAVPANPFAIKNASGSVMAYVDTSNGNMCIKSNTSCQNSDLQSSCSSPNPSFIIQNSTGGEVIVIDRINGNLCLTGGIYENVSQIP